MEYTVRPYHKDDYDFVWNLHIKENKPYIDRHMNVAINLIREWFDQGTDGHKGFIVENGDERLGCYFLYEASDHIKLGRFFLIDAAQGQGIGSRLLADILKNDFNPEKQFRVMVWEDNPVQEFWRKKGFVYDAVNEDRLMAMVYKPE